MNPQDTVNNSLFEIHLRRTGGGSDVIHLYCPDGELITRARRLSLTHQAEELAVCRNGVHLFTLLGEARDPRR